MGDIRLQARNLSRSFHHTIGVAEVDLEVAAGSVHALVGLNGAGKTTLLRLLLGMLRPDEGTVRVDGVHVRDADVAVWKRVGHLVEHPLVYPELDARTNLMVSARLHDVSPAEVPAVVNAALDQLDIAKYAGVRARVLSAGNRWRLGLAAALVHSPDVIVLDEPTNALDPAGIIMLRQDLVRRARNGTAVLVSSHHLDEVARVADQITVLNEGRVVGGLDPRGVDIERAFFRLVHADHESRGR